MAETALITGIAGQDGSYLAELLVERGVEVVGVDRDARKIDAPNLARVRDSIDIVEVELADPDAVRGIVRDRRVTQMFHLAGTSFVPDSWEHPTPVVEFAAASTAALLDAVVNVDRGIRFFHAASAEIFGRPTESPQREETPIRPATPYGAGKAFGHFLTGIYRERFEVHASSGILFNHESPRRPPDFVTRKITRGAVAIARGEESELRLGNLDAERDWCFAGDMVEGIAAMVDADAPGDYVLSSGTTHSIRDVLEIAFGGVGLDWRDHVVVDERFVRPAEGVPMRGDPSKAQRELGWSCRTSFEDLIGLMLEADLAEGR